MTRPILVLTIALLAAAAAAASSLPARAQSGLLTGFSDPGYERPGSWNQWLARTVSARGRLVLLPVFWAGVAPKRPTSGDPADPANPAYRWGNLDGAIQAATARGLVVALSLAPNGGPRWADALGRPGNVAPGTWKPDSVAFGQFAAAVAKRYSGRFNPGTGLLPRVKYFQAWSEPNLPDHLNPQWMRVGRRWIDESAVIYRQLLNAVYRSVKRVNPGNRVITGGTAPFGDSPGGGRVPPAVFVRDLLCLNAQLRPVRCPVRAHFDILAHHPYALGAPTQPAFLPDDVSVPDLAKLSRPLRAAVRYGTVIPRARKQMWVTEFSYNSRPPNPTGVPVRTQARWLEQTLYLLWKQRVSAIAWYLLVDQPCLVPSCQTTSQSGLFFINGRSKPAFRAFQFPFVTSASGRRSVVWAIPPRSGRLLVQILSHRRWHTLRSARVRAGHVFTLRLPLARHAQLRARVGSLVSLSWRVA